MSWIPGWDSITGTNSWANIYFWAGIAALLLLGVFEVFSHRYTERKDELVTEQQAEIQRKHDEEMARLQRESAQAKEHAAVLEKESASLRLELAKIKLPRNLSSDAQKRIAEKLKPFGSQTYSLGEGPIEADSNIDEQLIKTLEKAGWNLLPIPDGVLKSKNPKAVFMISDVFGISVDFSSADTINLHPIAGALASALTDEGIAVRTREVRDWRNVPHTLSIIIGPKSP
jgi:hypothetical protein